jgi:glucose-1-phosphate adenylyltransferase
MGIYVFSRDILLQMLEREAGLDFGRELIPNALNKYKVKPYLYRGYWADVGTIESFYEANVMLGRVARRSASGIRACPIYTHLRHLPDHG